MKYKLLIVDDEPANLRLLERLFSREFHCLTASSGAEAIRLLEQHDVAVLISDQRMPMMTGIELLKQTAAMRPHMVRILLTGYADVEALVEAINCGLVYMYITKPWSNDDLKLKVGRAGEHYENNKTRHSLALANERLLLRLKEMKLGVVTALVDSLRRSDEIGSEHALRVRNYALAIADKLGLGDDEKEDLSAAALLHDLGRSNINGNKLPKLPNEESSCQTNTECEARILAASPELGNVADIVRGCRENFDGSGYPAGWNGTHIPLPCRIIRVAEEYDLMTGPTHLPTTLGHNEAMWFMSQLSGKQLDPKLIEIMAQLATDELANSQFSMALAEV